MKQGVELTQGQRFTEPEEQPQIHKQKGLKIVEIWAEVFFEDGFDTVKDNLECFTIGNFKESSLFFSLEGLVCQALSKAENSQLGFGRHVDQVNNQTVAIIDAEDLIRGMLENKINSILDDRLAVVTDKKQIPNIVLAAVVCKDMTNAACDNIFEAEKQKMTEEYQQTIRSITIKHKQDEQEKVIKIFERIQKNPPEVQEDGFEFPAGYNPTFMTKDEGPTLN